MFGAAGLAAIGLASALTTITAFAGGITVTVISFQPVEGATFGGNVATFTVALPCFDNVIYTPSINWGDGHTTGGAVTVNGTCSNGFNVGGSNQYLEEGTYTITVTVTGSDGSSGTGSGPTTAADAALTSQGNTIGIVPHASQQRTVATFRDADAAAAATDYSATIDWGDGTPPTIGAIGGTAGSGFSVTGTHSYTKAGPFTTTTKISDVGGASTAATGKAAGIVVTVNKITLNEGDTFGGVIATFDDLTCMNSSYSDTVHWGDGTTSSAALLTNGGSCSGGYSLETSHSYVEGGSYTITVVVTATDGAGGRGHRKETVADVAVTGFSPPSGPAGTSVTISGFGFADATAVTFNGVSATFVVNSDNSMTAVVPAGATSGPIHVTTPGGTATSSSAFTVT
jgi:hypothetical protein